MSTLSTSSPTSSPALEYSAQPKLSTTLLSPMATRADLSLAYTPGIAEVCKLIQADESALFTHTFCRNNLAVISNGTAVLGLGDIGHKASYPVMEGKSMLFKRFADIDAIPLVINAKNIDEFVEIVVKIADSFGAINLEDIAAPACFEIEEKLKAQLNIPLMHDDQHGTAVVVVSALVNALKLIPHQQRESKIVLLGSGAAGVAIAKLLIQYGFNNLILVDSKGIVTRDRNDLDPQKQALSKLTNPENRVGDLATAVSESSVFIGVSRAGLLKPEMIKTMAQDPIVIAMANPIPEIMPDEARATGAVLVATGRSDFANQVNNALAFPGIFRGAMNARRPITEAMKVAAVEAIMEYHASQLSAENLMPSILDPEVHAFIAKRVQAAA